MSAYCCVFPRVALTEPIRLNSTLDFRHIGNLKDDDSDSEYSLFVNRLPQIIQRHFGYTTRSATVAVWDSAENLDDIMKRHGADLNLLRFLIMRDGLFHGYRETEYLLLGAKRTKSCELDYYNFTINGNEISNGFIKPRLELAHGRQPNPVPQSNSIGRMVDAYHKITSEKRERLNRAITRFISAHLPRRHSDDFLSIVNLVSGIEAQVSLTPNEGKKEFGQKLRCLLGVDELQDWGKQVYELRNDLVHQKRSPDPPSMCKRNDHRRLFFENATERNVLNVGHFRAAEEVLSQLIYYELGGKQFDCDRIKQLLVSNDLPFKRLAKMIQSGKQFGPDFYPDIEGLTIHRTGGKLGEKKSVAKYAAKWLKNEYPEAMSSLNETLDFNDHRSTMTALIEVYEKLNELREPSVLTCRDVAKYTEIEYIYKLWECVVFSLSQDLS